MSITRDPLFIRAAEFAVEKQQCGVSLLQRKFGISYSRAQRLIEQLQSACVVGEFDNSRRLTSLSSPYPVLADKNYLAELTTAAEETA